MSVYYTAMIGVGYIITKDKADKIYTEFPELEDNLIPLDGDWEKTNYLFGEIFYKCGPGEEREIHRLGELMIASERIENILGTILDVKKECPVGIHLIHQIC